jgi:hypothetical protein
MRLVTRGQVQLIVVLVLVVLWGIGVIVAQFDDSAMLRIMTPFTTMALGWLFAAHATGSQDAVA